MKINRKFKFIFSCLLIIFFDACSINKIDSNIDSFYYGEFNQKNINNLSPKIVKDKVVLNKPEDINSEKIKKEISDLNGHKLNSDEEYRISYWNNSIGQWLEIASDLGKKYNKNETELSLISNYLGDSQYDSLLNTFQNKYLYNRNFKENFKTPSYPSEKAAIAEVSANILIYFYPNEKEFLVKKAIESKETAFWGKENLKSDIESGTEIGRIISEKSIEIIKLSKKNHKI